MQNIVKSFQLENYIRNKTKILSTKDNTRISILSTQVYSSDIINNSSFLLKEWILFEYK